jgi:hypothetical protein
MNEHQMQTQSTIEGMLAQVNLIQQVMKAIMKEGTHYGKVPGCGERPSLLKPGAEKLAKTFNLRPIIDNDRDVFVEHLPNGHQNIRVYCHIMSPDGSIEIATGVGSCSTLESKYRYRGGEKTPTGEVVPKEYWNLKNDGRLDEAKKLIGGPGYGVAKIDGSWQICEIGEKMENPDIADQYNTVLKMAKKRAYVDGILSATAASDIFTQDVEDTTPVNTSDNGNHNDSPKNAPDAPKQPATSPKGLSQSQVNRFYAIVKQSGAIEEIVKMILNDEIPDNFTGENGKFNWAKVSKIQYDVFCKLFETGEWQSKYQQIMELEEISKNLPC